MLVGTVGVGRSGSPEGPRRFELVHIAVAAEYQRGGVGKSLMARLEELLARPDDCVQAAVPSRTWRCSCSCGRSATRRSGSCTATKRFEHAAGRSSR